MVYIHILHAFETQVDSKSILTDFKSIWIDIALSLGRSSHGSQQKIHVTIQIGSVPKEKGQLGRH